MLRILSTLLLSLVSAAHLNPQCAIEVGPIAAFNLDNDLGGHVALYSNPGAGQINWITDTSTHDYAYGGLGREWEYTEDKRIVLHVRTAGTVLGNSGQAQTNENLSLRACPVNGFLKLRAVPEATPLGAGEVEQFNIRCEDDEGNRLKCVVELDADPVAYRGNLIDLRPLVLDRDSKQSWRVNLWPSVGTSAQVFTIVKRA